MPGYKGMTDAEYANKYYHAGYKNILRKRRYGDRKCRLCEILLKSDFGGHGKKFYCDNCYKNGEARRHSIRMANRRFRMLHPDRVREAYYKWLEKKYVKIA